MNNGRLNYSSAPASGKQLQEQRGAAQNNYMGAAPGQPQQPYPGYPTPAYPQGQVNPAYPQGQTNPAYPQGQAGVNGQAPYGYPQGQAARPQQMPQGYGYPPQNGMGGYVPPQGQQAYPQGYGQNAAPQGYNGYQQPMYGYNQQAPQQPRKQPPRLDQIMWIVLCGVLPVIFVLGMIFSGAPWLKWVFIVLSALSVGFLWVRPVVSANTRLTFSAVYGALALVALVSALTGSAPRDTTSAAGGTTALNGGTAQVTASGSVNQDDGLGTWVTDPSAAAVVTPEPQLSASEAVAQMESFFYYWSVNNTENMVGLCAPSWVSSVDEPLKALFSIMANRTPVDYTTEKITGTDNDTTRTVTVVATIDKGNGRDPAKYRLQVVMLKESGVWYVDPRSLTSQEAAEETASADTDTATATPDASTASATTDPNTVLYYNPDGGTKYHLDSECKSTNSKYLPFKGTFKYSEINDDKYKDLSPCNVCGAPLR